MEGKVLMKPNEIKKCILVTSLQVLKVMVELRMMDQRQRRL